MNLQKLVKKCEGWFQKNQYERVIEELENLDSEKQGYELDGLLARAYIQLGQDTQNFFLCNIALKLLQQYEDEGVNDHKWNFRIGYALFYLERPIQALKYLSRANELYPSEITQGLIQSCHDFYSKPSFTYSFRERTALVWQEFAEQEQNIRQLLDAQQQEDNQELLATVFEILVPILYPALDHIVFDVKVTESKYELILSPEANPLKLFAYLYFAQHAPESVTKYWNIVVGKKPIADAQITIEDTDITARDVQVWYTEHDEVISLQIYNAQLNELKHENAERAQWLAHVLLYMALGDVAHLRYIDTVKLLEQRLTKPSVTLDNLLHHLENSGIEINHNAQDLIDSVDCYEREPDLESSEIRDDIIAGYSRCTSLIAEYNNEQVVSPAYVLENYGATAGFISFSVEGFVADNNFQAGYQLFEKLEEYLSTNCTDYVTVIGQATGVFNFYIDLLVWDLEGALDRIEEFLRDTSPSYVGFKVFRRDALMVLLKAPEEEEDE